MLLLWLPRTTRYFINVVGESQIDRDVLAFYDNNRLDPNPSFSLSEVRQNDVPNDLMTIKSQAVGVDEISQ